MHKLIIAAVPIGNLSDVSLHLMDTLESNDLFYCEDTRNTKKMFNLLKLETNKKFVSYHNFNEQEKIDNFKQDIINSNIVLVSDAGYPLISDPGYVIVDYCVKNNIEIEVVDGPCAIIHSLVKSGFNIDSFLFLGFLGHKKQEQLNQLNQHKNYKGVIVVYESVHKLFKTLEVMDEVFENQTICVAKELTKLHEKFYYGSGKQIIEEITKKNELKGEFVILIDNNKSHQVQNDLWKEKADFLETLKISKQDIIKIVMHDFKDVSKNEIYDYLIKNGK